uniref:Methylcytosine dioxygenase TET n=1 Tax=Macrostomum lignano TaxID=282301 RepID=A0A1I8JPL7_9PLAT
QQTELSEQNNKQNSKQTAKRTANRKQRTDNKNKQQQNRTNKQNSKQNTLKRKLTFLSLANAEFTAFNSRRSLAFLFATINGVFTFVSPPPPPLTRPLGLAASSRASSRRGRLCSAFRLCPAELCQPRCYCPEQDCSVGAEAEEAARGYKRRRSPVISEEETLDVESVGESRWLAACLLDLRLRRPSALAVPAASRKPPPEQSEASRRARPELQAPTEIRQKQSHICLAISGRDCKRTEIAKQSHICLAISGRRLQAHARLQSESHLFLRSPAGDCKRTEIAKPKTAAEGAARGQQQQQQGGHVNRPSAARPSLTQSIDPKTAFQTKPWLENNWEINPEAYENLCRLCIKQTTGTSASRRVHPADVLSVLRLQRAVEETSSGLSARRAKTEVSVGQLIQMHCLPNAAARCPGHLINLISECDSVRCPAVPA